MCSVFLAGQCVPLNINSMRTHTAALGQALVQWERITQPAHWENDILHQRIQEPQQHAPTAVPGGCVNNARAAARDSQFCSLLQTF